METGPRRLPAEALRWICDPASLGFSTTEEIEPIDGLVGQDDAVEALRFGLEIDAPGQNVFVRGLAGTGRSTLVQRVVRELESVGPDAPDLAFVHNFDAPDRPRLLSFSRGRGRKFRAAVEELCTYIVDELPKELDGEEVDARRKTLEREHTEKIESLTQDLDKRLAERSLVLMMAHAGETTRPVLVPVVDGEPAPPDRMSKLEAEQRIGDEDRAAIREAIETMRPEVEKVFRKVEEAQRDLRTKGRELLRDEATRRLERVTAPMMQAYSEDAVRSFLSAIVEDVVQRRVGTSQDAAFTHIYAVNLIVCHAEHDRLPVIVDHAATLRSLMGSVEIVRGDDGERRANHMSIHAGTLLRANGGVLVLDALELLQNPGAWRALVRTLRSGQVEISPPESGMVWALPVLQPEPVPIRLKVVLLGDTAIYELLDRHDPDFPLLFKVLADFESVIDRGPGAAKVYAAVLGRLAREESLPAFDAGAVASLMEHGCRIAGHRGKLTTRFGRLADLAREAAYLTRRNRGRFVTADEVTHAVARTKRRAGGPSRRFQELIKNGAIRVHTDGVEVGQINGLAVISSGPLTYGFPMRITSTVGPGVGGVINIERESQLSGAIHTKSFYILGGLLRSLLRTEHPLTLEASIAFEQSYGGIDGDSASAAETCCLLSALTGLPLRQDLAMTGAIDQLGNILPVGAVNEKIEGFFDTCVARGLTGTQGAILPASNAAELMLRNDVVEAARAGMFHVYAVSSFLEALELLFDLPAVGEPRDEPDRNTVIGRAMIAARTLWERSSSGPARLVREVDATEDILFATRSEP